METKYVLETADGKWATYDTRYDGARLTNVPGLRYVWDSAERAECQRPAYEMALNVKLSVGALPAQSKV